ncbi:MAG: addiction module protein [Campylobacterota bacterium]|nr:addiction module protein [Campylobacterota bacterium]
MSSLDKIIADILPLNTNDKLIVIDTILASLYPKNKGVEKIWEEEGHERIEAYHQGRVMALDEEDVLQKYRKS